MRSFDGPLAVGERLTFVPVHACTCVNLADRLYAVRDGEIAHESQGAQRLGDPLHQPGVGVQRRVAELRDSDADRRAARVPVHQRMTWSSQ